MDLQTFWHLVPVIVAAMTAIYLAVVAWQHRATPGAIYLMGLMVCMCWWLVGYGFEAMGATSTSKIFWVYVEYPAIALAPVMWVAFCIEYSGLVRQIPLRTLALLSIEPVITVLLVWTNSLHSLAWSGFRLDTSASLSDLNVDFGPALWVNIAYSVLLILGGAGLLIWSMVHRPEYRRRVLLFLTGVAIMLIAVVLDVSGHSPIAPWSLTPFAITFAGLLLVIGLMRLRVLNVVPLARETVIEGMSDGVIVLDISNHVADLNAAARSIIGCTTAQALGRPVEKIWKAWPGEMTLPLGQVEIVKSVSLNTAEGQRYYDLRISSLADAKGSLSGRLVVLRDITRQKRAEDALRRRDEILEAISFAAEQFLRRQNWTQCIQDVLGHLGEATGVSRVHLYENQVDNEGRILSNLRHEWAAWGVKPLVSSPDLQNISLPDTGFTRWAHLMTRGQAVVGTMPSLPPEEQAALVVQDVRAVVAVPIFLSKNWWGFLGFYDCSIEREWTTVEIDALRAAANTIGAAIQRERTEAEARRWADVISTLLSLTEIIGSTMNIPKVLDQVMLAARSLLPVDRVLVFLWDEKDQALIPSQPQANGTVQLGLNSEMGDELADLRLKADQIPLIRELQEKQKPIALNNVSTSPLIPARIAKRYRLQSLLAVPIVFQERFVGALYADYSSRQHTFTQQEIDLATALARQAALAIERGRLYAQSQQDAAELSSLYNASTQLLNPGHDLQSLAEQIVQTVNKDFASAYCSVLWVNQDLNRLETLAQAGYPGVKDIPLPLDGPGLTVYAAKHNEIIYAPNVQQDARYLNAADETHSEMVLPLHAGGRVFGVLNLESPEPDALDERARRILTAFAKDAALALQNTRLYIAAETHARQLSLLNEITRTALSNPDFQGMLQALADQMITLINSDECFITLWDEDHQRVMPGAASGIMRTNYKSVSAAPGEPNITASVLGVGHSLIVEDTHHSPYISPRLAGLFSTVSILGLPLIADEHKLGAVLIGFHQAHNFTKAEIWLCEQVSGQVALAISRAWSLEVARTRAHEAETLRQASAIVAQTLEEEKAIPLIMEQLAHVVPYDSASVQLLRGDCLEIVGVMGFAQPKKIMGTRFPIPGDNPNTIVVQTRQPLILGNTRQAYDVFTHLDDEIISWLGVPLVVGERVIGMLSVDSKQPDYFTPAHSRLASAFADQVAIAIENARLYAAEQKRVQQLDALRATGADISVVMDLSSLLQTILERAVALLDATGGQLGLYLDSENALNVVASHNLGQDFSGTRISMGEGAMGLAAEMLEPQMIKNYQQWEGRSAQLTESTWQAVMASPMLGHGRLVGAIAVIHTGAERQFTKSDLQLLTMFAQQSAIAVENARLYQEARQAAERRAVLHRVTQEVVSASLDQSKIYEAIHRAAQELMPTEAFAITLVNDQLTIDSVFLIDQGVRADQTEGPMENSLSQRVITSGKLIYIEDTQAEPEKQGVHFGSGEDTRSILAAPLRTSEKIIGMISAQSYTPHAYTTEDQALLEMLAANAAIAIDNARMLKQINFMANTDPLTGLYNRRGFFELGEREVVKFRRLSRPLSAILLDIDFFKQINDTYGHAAGDQVLVGLSSRLRSQIRTEMDIIGRYGGEEIVILLPETDLKGGLQVAERLRRCVEKEPFSTDRSAIQITISLGVAEFQESTADLATLLDRADSAMYVAKQSGRNQSKAYDGRDLSKASVSTD